MYNEKTKLAIMKWRNKNREHYNEVTRKAGKKHYEAHKEEKNKKDLARYYLKKELELFRHILLID